jgi:hypothetical protein
VLAIGDVRDFCRSRDVDLVLVPPPHPFTLCFRGEFDGYGDFFRLVATDVEYVEMASGFTVGDIVSTEAAKLGALRSSWARLVGKYSGPAIAFRTVDTDTWETEGGAFVIVANRFEWHAGPGWSR